MAADAEALAHYRQALEAYARVRGDDWQPIERARLERKIGQALYRLGQHRQARLYLERSLALLGEDLPSSRWGTRLAVASALLTQAAHRLLPRLFVRPMRGSLDPVAEEIYLASESLAGAEVSADSTRFLLLMLRALNTSERRGYAYGSATMTANMGLGAVMAGRFGLAESYYRHSAEYAGHIVPPRPNPYLELTLSAHYNVLTDLDQMREHSLRAMEIARETGHLRVWGMASANFVWSLWGRGEYDNAAEACEELLRTAEDSSDRQLVVWALLPYGCIQRRRGQVHEAIATHLRAVEIAEDLPDYLTLAGLGGWMGRSHLALGEVEQAIELMQDSERTLARQKGNLPGYVYLGNGLAEAYLTRAEDNDGKARRAWLEKANAACGHAPWPRPKRAACATRRA
jgi:tetratricopeptide (TPR) repeat protein